MTALPDRFRAHLGAARLFTLSGEAVVAVSGGADSVALLDLLHAVAPELGLTLVVAHADHGIQPDSGKVAQSVRDLAARYRLPFELGGLALGPGTSETTARRARYEFLRDVQRRRGARYLVTAHQRDDQVETILLRVLRGSAPAGLAGIPARGRAGLVRPLLSFTRAALTAHVQARGLRAHDDPSNRDPRHLRSWVRQTLVPLLTERLGPQAERDLRRLGREAARDRRAWDRVLELLPALGLQLVAQGFTVARPVLAGYDDAVSVALLRAAARRAGLVLGPARARRVATLAKGRSGRRVELGGGWTAEAAFDELRVRRTDARKVGEVEEVGEVGEVVGHRHRGAAEFGAFSVRWRPERAPRRVERQAWTTWVSVAGWALRRPRAGDRLEPLGGVGRRPVRRLLMEAHVPKSERGAYPVLARGKTILWVPGICRSGDDVPQPGTRAVRVDVTDHRGPEADRRA
ncbi:MAG TPA: tRNA lysidine(34) synthetase TilS [Gemmatimonadales bacterium]